MKEIVGLEQVLNADIVLVDGSVKQIGLQDGTPLGHYLHDCSHFAQVDDVILEDSIEQAKEYQGLISKDNVFLCEGCPEEIKAFSGIISDSLKYYNSNISTPKSKEKRNQRCNRAKIKLEELQRITWENQRLARLKLLKQNNLEYEYLKKMVGFLDEIIGLERTYDPISNRQIKSQKVDPVDIGNVSLAYSLALQGNNVNMLVRDGDHIRMLTTCASIIGGDEFLPENERFRKALTSNPIKIYWKTNKRKEYQFVKDTNDQEFKERFYLTGSTKPISVCEAKDVMCSYMKDFAASAEFAHI